jgi:hypothetical protein
VRFTKLAPSFLFLQLVGPKTVNVFDIIHPWEQKQIG